jgi:glycosyltransferase involved in cell wall biosynthesis
LRAIKGHSILLKAIPRLGFPTSVIFAGAGPLLEDLRKQAEELGVSNSVRFIGHVAHSELMRLLESGTIDVVVLPSLELSESEHEGIPVALMEAMARGIPVVSTRTGSIPELVTDAAGLLVEQNDSEALAVALRRLHLDSSLREGLVTAGRRVVEARFSAAAAAAQLSDWIEEAS